MILCVGWPILPQYRSISYLLFSLLVLKLTILYESYFIGYSLLIVGVAKNLGFSFNFQRDPQRTHAQNNSVWIRFSTPRRFRGVRTMTCPRLTELPFGRNAKEMRHARQNRLQAPVKDIDELHPLDCEMDDC